MSLKSSIPGDMSFGLDNLVIVEEDSEEKSEPKAPLRAPPVRHHSDTHQGPSDDFSGLEERLATLDAAKVDVSRRLLSNDELFAACQAFGPKDALMITQAKVFDLLRKARPGVTNAILEASDHGFKSKEEKRFTLEEFLMLLGGIASAVSTQAQAAATRRASAHGSPPKGKTLSEDILSRRQSNVKNRRPSLGAKMYNKGARKEEESLRVYINVGGLDSPEGSRPPHEVLAGYNLRIIASWEYDGWLRNNEPGSPTGAFGSGKVTPSLLGAPTPGVNEEDVAFSTVDCEIDGAAIWNESFRVNVPLNPIPDSLRLELQASASCGSGNAANSTKSLEEKDDSKSAGTQWSPPIRLATARLQIGQNLVTASWSEEIHLARFNKVPLTEALLQESQNRSDGPESSSDNDHSISDSVSRRTMRRGSTGVSANLPNPEENTSGSADGTLVDSLLTPSSASRRISVLTRGSSNARKRRDTPSVAAMIHTAMPNDIEIGVAVVKFPTKLGMIESIWEMRRLNSRISVRLMEQPWYMLSPFDTASQQWDFVMLFAMVYVSIITVFEVSVMSSGEGLILAICNRLVDLIFFIDMVMQFWLGYYDKVLKQMVFDQRHIAKRYVSTWFVFDFMSIFPFWLLNAEAFAGLRMLKIVRLVKLAKLTRLARMGDVFLIQSQYLLLMKSSALLFFLLHWVACAWCLLAEIQETSGRANWIRSLQENEFDPIELTGSASRYLHGLEFAIFAMVLAYSRAHPTTVLEQVFGVTMLVTMGCVYAYLIGSICGIISTMDPAGTEFNNTKDLLKSWTSEMRLDPELKMTLLEYLDECRLVIRQRYYHSLLDLLSPVLRGKISQHTHGMWLQKIDFFRCDDMKERRNFTMAVAEKLSMVVYGKGETIASSGEDADRMCIITKGVVTQSSGTQTIVLCPGKYFGEDMLLANGKHQHTSCSITFVTLNVLAKSDLFVALKTGRYTCTWRSIRKWIVHRAFVRAVRALVHLRRAFPGYKAMSKDQFKKQKDRLIKIGRRGFRAKRSKSGSSPDEHSVEIDEIDAAISHISHLGGAKPNVLEQIEYTFADQSDSSHDPVASQFALGLTALRSDMQTGMQGLQRSISDMGSDMGELRSSVDEFKTMRSEMGALQSSMDEVKSMLKQLAQAQIGK